MTAMLKRPLTRQGWTPGQENYQTTEDVADLTEKIGAGLRDLRLLGPAL
jgi:hypothetical protein